MQLRVNELKALVVIADLSESEKNITSEQCMSVQHFDYHCARKRDQKGRTYQAAEPTMLCFSVRINAADQAKPFYSQMMSQDAGIVSFIFNASFNDTHRLQKYDDAMVVNGFVVDVQEDFCSAAATEQNEEQIILRARMQVCSITYMGETDNKVLSFVQ